MIEVVQKQIIMSKSVLCFAIYTLRDDDRAKSYIIYGDTIKYKEKIKKIGGKFIKSFNHPVPDGCDCGWIVSAKRIEEVRRLCEDPDAFEIDNHKNGHEKNVKKQEKLVERQVLKSKCTKDITTLELLGKLDLTQEQLDMIKKNLIL